ncbi:hypothetical protein [Stygiolobus azoricus]|uniref:Uncharacterized protein n=1 Tax=Stygiolobus azoricus TaxID=41675 RepID=A0A650CRW3_9CREN|nr:hypothetical protein [Stygiolobus azoricus]QGR20538.1 hypothetical protein D1868_07480 [Stygiolobus azoricus]
MKIQVKGDYIYVTMWDKLSKRPKRYYLGRKEELKKWEELFTIAREYKVSEDDVRDYLNYYLDKETNMTKVEYVLLSLSLGVEFWRLNGNTKTLSEKQ